MFRFLGQITSGVAHGIGIGIGLAIWGLLRKLVRFAMFGGAAVVALNQTGVATVSQAGMVRLMHQLAAVGAGSVDSVRMLLGH